MYSADIQLRVRYAETDRMGYVYYGHYAQYFEVARTELMRQLGFSYRQSEAEGILLPVIDYQIKYLKPAQYDDLLIIRTCLPKMPRLKICFQYQVFNADELLLAKAETTLVFVDAKNRKPRLAPQKLIALIEPYFNKQT